MKRKLFLTISGVSLFFFIAGPAWAEGQGDISYGFWTVLPPLVAILLAFITKNVVLSLFLGIYTGAVMVELQKSNFVMALLNGFLLIVTKLLESLADKWNAGIILQVLVIGGLIALISKMGGALALAEALAVRAKTPRSAQLTTWFLGLLVFFDDYANSLIVGPIMRTVTDKLRISREKLAFIIDATAAPIAGIALISTWVGYEIGLIKDAYEAVGQDVNAYGIFVATIPYRFYNILMLIFVVFTAFFVKEFGPMLRAERRARKTGKVVEEGAVPMASDEATNLEPKEGIRLNKWNAIIPILVLILAAFAGFYFNGYRSIMAGDNQETINLLKQAPMSIAALRETFGASDASIVLFQAALFASIVAIIQGLAQKIFTLAEAIDTWIMGWKSLVITMVILLLAWSLSSVISELGTADFLVSVLSDTIPKFLLPSIIFIMGAIISFSTGTSYGTMGILMPLAIPLAFAISPESNYVIMTAGAVLTGAIFGDHCSPISDTTILASMGSACDHIDHTKTQLWYAISIAIITIVFGYIPVGLGISVYIVLPTAILVVGALVYFLGQPVEE